MSIYKKSVQTYSGMEFNLLDLEGNPVEINDIAHALSQICRWCGMSREHYSVAQHSVLVSLLVPHEYALHGLLHDASEAYIGDVAKPLKELLPEYKEVEARVERYVLAQFGIDADNMPPCIKRADMEALVTEQRDLMHGPDPVLMKAFGVEPLRDKIRPVTPGEAKQMFLRRYYEITRPQNVHRAPYPLH